MGKKSSGKRKARKFQKQLEKDARERRENTDRFVPTSGMFLGPLVMPRVIEEK